MLKIIDNVESIIDTLGTDAQETALIIGLVFHPFRHVIALSRCFCFYSFFTFSQLFRGGEAFRRTYGPPVAKGPTVDTAKKGQKRIRPSLFRKGNGTDVTREFSRCTAALPSWLSVSSRHFGSHGAPLSNNGRSGYCSIQRSVDHESLTFNVQRLRISFHPLTLARRTNFENTVCITTLIYIETNRRIGDDVRNK